MLKKFVFCKSSNQYKDSLHSFKEIYTFAMKSFLLTAHWASAKFAPILVPLLNNWSDILYSRFSSLRKRQRFTTRIAKFMHLSFNMSPKSLTTLSSFELWVLSYEFWIMSSNYEFWIMNYELLLYEQLWVLNYELWVMSYELWIMNYELLLYEQLWITNFELWIINYPILNRSEARTTHNS